MKRQRRILVTIVIAMGLAGATWAATTRTWNNGAWDSLPAATDDIIVVQGTGNLTWSNTFPATVASWTQDATYSGTATFTTVYGATGFTTFTVSGASPGPPSGSAGLNWTSMPPPPKQQMSSILERWKCAGAR